MPADPRYVEARRVLVGLEAALIDNSEMSVTALDPADSRSISIKVARVPALLVAKIHKLSDRLAGDREDRQDDKDAADVVRLMGAADATSVAATLAALSAHASAGEVTLEAIERFGELFGSRAGEGIQMASRSLRTAIPAERVRAICLAYVEELRNSL